MRAAFSRAAAWLGLGGKPAASRTIYAGAAGGRLNLDWIMSYQSADWELRADLRTLRLRSRQLRRDNPWARAFVELCSDNIIGPHGVQLRAVAETTRGEPHTTHNTALEAAWKRWGRLGICTADGKLCWQEVETLAVETWKTDGEFLLQLIPGAANDYGFAVQPLDTDQLDETYNVPGGVDRNEVRMGVEVDANGRPVAYHLWSRHPSEGQRAQVRRRVPAELIVHLYDLERPGQTRGIPAAVAAMQTLKMLEATDEAILVSLRTAACKMGWLEVDPEKTRALEPDTATDPAASRVAMEAEPGLIEQLPAGITFKPWDPNQPPAQYDAFTAQLLRKVAAGWGVSYMSLTGDLSAANYSSQRGGLLRERDGWRRQQRWVIERLHARVFQAWFKYAALAGAVRVPGFDLEQYGAVEWQPRGFDWVDPAKDADAALTEVNAGLNSLTRIAASKGRDFATILAERATEQALADQLGVSLNLGKPPALPKETQAPTDAADGADSTGGANANPNRNLHAVA